MPPPGNRLAGADPELARFLLYLKAERGVSGNTLAGYAADLAQLVSSKWGVSAEPPYPWGTLDEGDARGFLLAFAQAGALPATVRRKLASARSFCRFLQRGAAGLSGTLDLSSLFSRPFLRLSQQLTALIDRSITRLL